MLSRASRRRTPSSRASSPPGEAWRRRRTSRPAPDRGRSRDLPTFVASSREGPSASEVDGQAPELAQDSAEAPLDLFLEERSADGDQVEGGIDHSLQLGP